MYACVVNLTSPSVIRKKIRHNSAQGHTKNTYEGLALRYSLVGTPGIAQTACRSGLCAFVSDHDDASSVDIVRCPAFSRFY